MISTIIESNNKEFSISLSLKTEGKKRLRICLEDTGKPNSKYADRTINVDNSWSIYFNFPVSPKQLTLKIVNLNELNDKNIQVTTMLTPLRSYNIWIDEPTQKFLKLSIPFAQVCGFEQASPNGRIFTNKSKSYTIKFFDIIRDYKTGRLLNTPARIGHQTGNIEVAKIKFDKYTIPMRMMILLHEYSHVYRNPKIELPIDDEVGADINALYLYLGLGFSKIDAICVYANVFLKAQTQGNVKRMRKIMDYIAKFENQDFAYRK